MSSNGKLGTSARSLLICLFKSIAVMEVRKIMFWDSFFFCYRMSSENVTMHE